MKINTRKCIICSKPFVTPWKTQLTCGEECRIKKYKMGVKFRSSRTYKQEKLNDYLERIRSFDKRTADWIEKNPIIVDEYGDVSLYPIPKGNYLSKTAGVKNIS